MDTDRTPTLQNIVADDGTSDNPERELLMHSTDYMVTEKKFSNNIKITIPTRKNWKENSVMNEEEISVSTDEFTRRG